MRLSNEVFGSYLEKYFPNNNQIYYVDDLACVAMKDAISCDNPKVEAYSH